MRFIEKTKIKYKILSKIEPKVLTKENQIHIEKLQTMAKEILNKHFKDLNLPVPEFKLRDTMELYEAQDVYNPSKPDNTTIEIQKRALSDESTVRRILAHELIHHAEFLTEREKATNKFLNRFTKGHGTFFKEWMNKINSSEGTHYVTEKSDQSYSTVSNKEYYLYVKPVEGGKYGVAIFVRPSPEQKEILKNQLAKNEEFKIFKVRDQKFWNSTKLKKYGVSVYNSADIQKELKHLYETGKDETKAILGIFI